MTHPLLAIRITLELISGTFESHQNKPTHVNDTDNQANNGLSKFVMLFFPDENKFTW